MSESDARWECYLVEACCRERGAGSIEGAQVPGDTVACQAAFQGEQGLVLEGGLALTAEAAHLYLWGRMGAARDWARGAVLGVGVGPKHWLVQPEDGCLGPLHGNSIVGSQGQ